MRAAVDGLRHRLGDGAARRAGYESGSGARYLNFEYTVQAGDFDSDGISLCANTFLDVVQR